jgi:hypothetical protein
MSFAIGFGLVAAVLAFWCGRVVWLKRHAAKSGSAHHGAGPYREGEVSPEPRESRFASLKRRIASAAEAFLGRRDAQVSLRLSAVLAFAFLALYGALAYWGGGVPHSTLQFGDTELTLSRLWDVPAVGLLVAFCTMAIGTFRRFGDTNPPDWFGVLMLLSVLVYAVFGVCGVPIAAYARHMGTPNTVLGLAVGVTALGVFVGFCWAFLSDRDWPVPLATLSAFSLCHALVAFPLGIGSGFAVGLAVTVAMTLLFALICVSTCGLMRGLIWLFSYPSSFLMAFFRWLSATELAKKED